MFEDARTAAAAATVLLESFGLKEFEIGFHKSIVTHSNSNPKMLSYYSPDPPDPLRPLRPSTKDSMLDLRKPFTPILGLPISSPIGEGTGALYLRESEGSNRIYLLTCSHVVRPENDKLSSSHRKDLHDKISAPGPTGYQKAIQRIETTIQKGSPKVANLQLVGKTAKAEALKQKVRLARNLRIEIQKNLGDPEARVMGEVTYAPPMRASADSTGSIYLEDWALIELDNDKFNWTTFKGNQVYVRFANVKPELYLDMMYPNENNRHNRVFPANGLLQVANVISKEDFYNPQHLDKNGNKCMFVLKNGLTTHTTFGCTTGMESIICNGLDVEPKAIAIYPYSDEGPPGPSPTVAVA
ncbi:hypothetical protein F5878DRAFT_648114 [Lentinula raphanica]|uniref:Uncharacterized protein n=1 Tax=Lentinula raphanica TaxID=153919 RepID=A0AA38U3F4_9AGAR|nr:hypothetical protein F5878DRAFT_648114 [Lentinula raphanica]